MGGAKKKVLEFRVLFEQKSKQLRGEFKLLIKSIYSESYNALHWKPKYFWFCVKLEQINYLIIYFWQYN